VSTPGGRVEVALEALGQLHHPLSQSLD
jgi:hypothetical protein